MVVVEDYETTWLETPTWKTKLNNLQRTTYNYFNSNSRTKIAPKWWQYYYYGHCLIFAVTFIIVVLSSTSLTQDLDWKYNVTAIFKTSSLSSDQIRVIRSAKQQQQGNNILIMLKPPISSTTSTGHQSNTASAGNTKPSYSVLDMDHFVPFRCPCGSVINSNDNLSCNNLACCACELKCLGTEEKFPFPICPTTTAASSEESAATVAATVDGGGGSYEEMLINLSEKNSRQHWSCDHSLNYFSSSHLSTTASLSATATSIWFPYICLYNSNLIYLGNYYEKIPKSLLKRIQKGQQRVTVINSQQQPSKSKEEFLSFSEKYIWKNLVENQHQVQKSSNETSKPFSKVNNGTDDEPAASSWTSITNSTNLQIKSLSKCIRSLGFARPGISSYLPCPISISFTFESIENSTATNSAAITSNCDTIRNELDLLATELARIHLKTENNDSVIINGETRTLIQIKLVNHSGVFEHESIKASSSGGSSSSANSNNAVFHCANLTLGLEIITSFYYNQILQIQLNYMKRDDQLISKVSDSSSTTTAAAIVTKYNRIFQITSATVESNFTYLSASKKSKFWVNILEKECPAEYCWRDLLWNSLYPEQISNVLLLPYEKLIFTFGVLGLFGIMAAVLVHEFMCNEFCF